MRSSAWSSDVCSSDLTAEQRGEFGRGRAQPLRLLRHCLARHAPYRTGDADRADAAPGKITHRQGDAAHVIVELAVVVGDALAAHRREHAAQRPLAGDGLRRVGRQRRSEEHKAELQSLMRIPYAVFCWKKKKDLSTAPSSTGKIIEH